MIREGCHLVPNLHRDNSGAKITVSIPRMASAEMLWGGASTPGGSVYSVQMPAFGILGARAGQKVDIAPYQLNLQGTAVVDFSALGPIIADKKSNLLEVYLGGFINYRTRAFQTKVEAKGGPHFALKFGGTTYAEVHTQFVAFEFKMAPLYNGDGVTKVQGPSPSLVPDRNPNSNLR